MKNKKIYAVMDQYAKEDGLYTAKLKVCVKHITEYVYYFDPSDFCGWDEEFEEWRQSALSYLKKPSLGEFEELIKNIYLQSMLKINWYYNLPIYECFCSAKRLVYTITDHKQNILLYDTIMEAKIEATKQLLKYVYGQPQICMPVFHKAGRWVDEALAFLQHPSSKKYEKLLCDDVLDELLDDYGGSFRPREMIID